LFGFRMSCPAWHVGPAGRAVESKAGATLHDLIIKGGTVVDGTGRQPVRADVGIDHGRVTRVGRITDAGRREVDADGLLVTPGFVDIHTHFDGQATWDPILAPSAWHGVTSAAMGNCGVGFAPASADRHEWLIGLMEGVEDIPGTALNEGITWGWESFPEYLSVVESRARTLDIGVHVPHAALRAFVMGDRGADPGEHPSDPELARMARLLAEAVAAGAIGIGSSRTEAHRTSSGAWLGTLRADQRELVAMSGALKGTAGVIQLISDCYQSADPEFVESELALIEAMARASGRPLSFSVQQAASAPTRWRELASWVADTAGRGLNIRMQVAPRPIGVVLGLTASSHPFRACPGYKEVAGLPLAARVAALAQPALRDRILAEHRAFASSLPEGGLARQIMTGFHRMFRFDDPVDYDLHPGKSLAPEGKSPEEAAALVYNALLEDEGRALLYCPLFNFADGNLDAVREMNSSAHSLFGLSDAGAHCGAISDGSFTTSYLTLWGRDRPDGFPIEQVVRRITLQTARHVGWHDRGALLPGMIADVNILDMDRLGCAPPEITDDLPAGGSRLVQKAYGYVHTFKHGVETFAGGEHTGELPGRLLRGSQPAAP
jgi:N-acyl-D-aspartate/D-glutamate deacylase